MDFETFSTAGYVWSPGKGTYGGWIGPPGAKEPGLRAVGANVYARHPSTEVLCLAFNLKDGVGPQVWLPGMPLPQNLFDYLATGGPIRARYSMFEYLIWHHVLHVRQGWPELPFWQLRDSAARCRAYSLPGSLEDSAIVMGALQKKDPAGKRLIKKLSVPRAPTKHNRTLRLHPKQAPEDAAAFYRYCVQDIATDDSVCERIPDLTPDELETWVLDQDINARGVYVDREGLENLIAIVDQAKARYPAELIQITDGFVQSSDSIIRMKEWLLYNGLPLPNLQSETIKEALKQNIPDNCRRVLEIRATLSSTSVAKLYMMHRQLTDDNRLMDMFTFCGADRTYRFAAHGPQPHNIPKKGPKVQKCWCGQIYARKFDNCSSCGTAATTGSTHVEWSVEASEAVLETAKSRDLDLMVSTYGDVLSAISGAIRGLYCAAPGHELISSDFSAIEAVVLAMLAGEQWRIDVFRTHGLIYETSASKITGIPLQEFIDHKKATKEHLPERSQIGKPVELALGYQGGVGAMKAPSIRADKYLSEAEMENAKVKWRQASPMIVKLWYQLQDCAIAAVQQPGVEFAYRGITYIMHEGTLYCNLPSGQTLKYHQAALEHDERFNRLKLTYWGWNTDGKRGPRGWIKLDTYGGKLVENATQAIAGEILKYSMKSLARAGFPIVLHVHDEIVSDPVTGTRTLEEFESIMNVLPPWAVDWPVVAKGGWVGQRFRKD